MSILKKMTHAAKNPTRALKWIKRKYLQLQNKVLEPIYKKKRNILLSKPSGNWQVVKTASKNLKEMDFKKLTSALLEEEKRLIDWSQLPSNRNSASKRTKVSIIVLVLNNREMSLRCLESILNAKTNLEYELIVVDNGSHYPTIKALTDYKIRHPEINLVLIDQNLNFSLGNNVGFKFATGNICVFLNNDTYVTDKWLESIIEPLENKAVGAVQPLLVYPDNTIQCAGIVFSSKSPLGYSMYSGMSSRNINIRKSRKVQAVTGACLAIRSRDFAQLRGFDVSFVNGQEDVDLCLRLLSTTSRNYNYVAAKAKVYHDEGKTPGRGKRVVFNRELFVSRWRNKVVADDEKNYRRDGFKVKNWTVDLEDYKSKGIEVYIPNLRRL